MEYEELKSKIQSLETLPFDFQEIQVTGKRLKSTNFLRKAQIYHSQINEENKELKSLLDTILKNRFKKLAPHFSEEQLKNMLNFVWRGYVIFPMDLLVIENAVFVVEAVLSDFGELYKYNVIMYSNENSDYFAIDSYEFKEPRDIFEPEPHTPEDEKKALDYMCDMINKALCEKFGCEVIMPLYKINTDKVNYGYLGLLSKLKNVNFFFNKHINEIVDSVLEQSQFDVKMVVQDDDDISLYTIHQTVENDVLIWNIIKSKEKTWRLSEAASNELAS